jgi:hypothetical protein
VPGARVDLVVNDDVAEPSSWDLKGGAQAGPNQDQVHGQPYQLDTIYIMMASTRHPPLPRAHSSAGSAGDLNGRTFFHGPPPARGSDGRPDKRRDHGRLLKAFVPLECFVKVGDYGDAIDFSVRDAKGVQAYHRRIPFRILRQRRLLDTAIENERDAVRARGSKFEARP